MVAVVVVVMVVIVVVAAAAAVVMVYFVLWALNDAESFIDVDALLMLLYDISEK